MKNFGRNIYNGEITLKEADGDQRNFFVEILNFQDRAKPQEREKKTKEKNVLKSLYILFDGRERVPDAFESKIFPIKNIGTRFLKFRPF